MFGDLIFSKRIACLYIQNIKKSSVSYMVLGEVQIFQARKDPYFTYFTLQVKKSASLDIF